MRVLVTRPQEDAGSLMEQIEAMGHQVVTAPLLEIIPDPPRHVDLTGVQAVAATSRNALRAIAGCHWLPPVLQLPMLAVGAATAEAARSLGFRRVVVGPGDARGLALIARDVLRPAAGVLLHLSGSEIAFDLAAALQPEGYATRRVIVYRTAERTELPSQVADRLRHGEIDAVLLMSPRTAEVYARLVISAGLAEAARRPAHLCLSERIAARLAALAPDLVKVSAQPTTEEMLALVGHLAAQSPPWS